MDFPRVPITPGNPLEPTLSFSCSRSDSPLSWRPAPLTLSSLMIWYSGLTALFLFYLAKAAPAYLPTAFSVALRPLFPFQQAQCVQVFPLKLEPFRTIFAGLSFYVKLSGTSDRNYLFSPSVLSGYNGSPGTRFSRVTTRLMSWPHGERNL